MSNHRYTVEVKHSAQKAFSALPRDIQKQIAEKLLSLETAPFQPGCKKISGRADTWRIRAGSYRIVYEVRENVLVVIVIRIGHRREIYRNL